MNLLFLKFIAIVFLIGCWCGSFILAQDEFKIKRETVYEFSGEVEIKKQGDTYNITFVVKSFCDVTIAIEDSNGKIIRHLCSGVLGKNAPQPFMKDSLKQNIIWNGKNDQEKYVDNIENYKVRVSLGLKPQFEKTMNWSENRRIERRAPLLAPSTEGMVVYEGGQAMDFIKLYHHDGSYNKSLYPFPADKISSTVGLLWHTFPQDGKSSPIKGNFLQNTMLTSGDNASTLTYKSDKNVFNSVVSKDSSHYGMKGYAATTIATNKNKLAVIHLKLNRLSIEGDTGGLPLEGSQTSMIAPDRSRGIFGKSVEVGPSSSAISPDGAWIYMTGYTWSAYQQTSGFWREWLHCVTRIKYDGSGKPELIIGSDKIDDSGNDNTKLNVPTNVQIDSKGNLYVTDYMNDRVQIFTLDGKYKRSIKIEKPVNIFIDEKRNEFYISSWFVKNTGKVNYSVKKPILTKFQDIDNPKVVQSFDLPLEDYNGIFENWDQSGGLQYNAVVNVFGETPKVWVIGGSPRVYATHQLVNFQESPWVKYGLKILSMEKDKLILEKDFGKEASKELARLTPPLNYRQKIYVNPQNENLYLWEGQPEDGTGAGKAAQELVEFNTKTGESKLVTLPFDAEDLAFDANGLLYLKTQGVVARFQIEGMKEIPWDYGSEETKVGFAAGKMGKQHDLISGLKIPGNLNWQNGGMFMTAKGELIVASYLDLDGKASIKKNDKEEAYQPVIYPGRAVGHSHGGTYINVWDERGKVIVSDAVPGLAELDGIGMDTNGSLYMMTHATRVFDNIPYYNDMSGTILKFNKGKGKILSVGGQNIPIELEKTNMPKRSYDLKGGFTGFQWAEECEWLYGGVGFGGKNKGVGCACWNSKYTLDYFARSFAPELDRYKVAILDSNGNLIVRVGQYGNVDDGKPIDLKGGPKNPRSIGGDEVALFHGAYLATHTDRHLYIADPGNMRILKVKLGYSMEKIISLSK